MGNSQWLSRSTVPDLFIRRCRRSSGFCRQLLQAKHPLLIALSGSLLVSAPAWGETMGADFTFTKNSAVDFIALTAKTSKNLQVGSTDITFLDSPFSGVASNFLADSPAKPEFKSNLVSLPYSRRADDLNLPTPPLVVQSFGNGSDSSWSFTELPSIAGLEEPISQQIAFNQPSSRDRPFASGISSITDATTNAPNVIAATIAGDPNSPTVIPVPPKCSNPDPELGCLRLQDILPAAIARAPVLYLIPRLDFYRSDNILSGIDPLDDGLVRPGVTLLAFPQLGPDTFLNAAVEAGFSRYFKVSQFNYDELRLRAGIFQRLSPTMSAEIGWSNQQLFIASDRLQGFPKGTRFLNDQALRFELSRRDQLAKKLFLSSFYQFRVGFAVPAIRSRIINVVFLSLNYDFNPNIQLGIDYQLALANYTQTIRTDLYQQLLGRITYNAFRNTQLSVYSGYSFGNSTEAGINFNSFILGVSVTVNIVLF